MTVETIFTFGVQNNKTTLIKSMYAYARMELLNSTLIKLTFNPLLHYVSKMYFINNLDNAIEGLMANRLHRSIDQIKLLPLPRSLFGWVTVSTYRDLSLPRKHINPLV